jgi:tetratricopeptide (TPR) repeat protein
MSLLLDALKRAEEAKRNGESQPLPVQESGGSGELPPIKADELNAPPLITRDRLPDISQSLEILADDLPPPLQGRRTSDRSVDPGLGAPPRDPAAAQAQAAARRLFEAKSPPASPVKAFHIVCAALAVAAIAIGIYFWYQLQPRPNAVARIAPPPAAVAPAARPEPRAPLRPPHAAADDMIVPPLPSAPVVRRPLANADVAPEVQPARKAPIQAAGPQFNRTAAAGPTATEEGYAAYQRGDFVAARAAYETALTQEPNNSDALLGIASVEARAGRYDNAEARYVKALEADPRNPHAQAGLIALRGQTDPAKSEARLRQLLAQQPDSGFLNFAMANLYAAQGRWSEAQQLYFKAYVAEPENPDFAFNLAVSLDHLRQGRPAADYYRKALADPAQRGNFNRAQAELRLRELIR